MLGEASVSCARDAGVEPPTIALQTLGLVAFWSNEPDRAVELMEAAIARSRADDNLGTVAFQLNNLGFFLGQAGQVERAIAVGEEALAIARELGAQLIISSSSFTLGLSYRSVDPERALRLLEDSFALGEVGDRVNAEWWYLALAQVQVKLAHNAEALASCRESLEASRRMGARFAVPTTLETAARVSTRLARLDFAARMLGAAEHLRGELEIAGGPADTIARERTVARLRDTMGDEAFDAAFAAGRALGIDDALILLDAELATEL